MKGIKQWVTKISIVLWMDAYNPLDRLVIEPLVVSSNLANLRGNSVFWGRNLVWSYFKNIGETGLLYILLSAENTEAVHRLQAFLKDGKRIDEIELFAEEKLVVFNSPTMSLDPFLIGTLIGVGIMRIRAEWKQFASYKLTDAKIISVIPVSDPETNKLMYQINFDNRENSSVANSGTFNN